MAPRAMWTGQIRISLVTFGVRLYAATESSARVSMNQLHRDCHQRVKNQLVCPSHGPINREDVVKGYQYEKDTYVIVTPEDLESIRLPSTKSIDLVQFVDAGEIDPLFFSNPYFLGPDGPVAEEPFRVIREAMKRTGRIGIGKITLQGREHVVALQVNGRGFLLQTLRYAAEVRQGDQFFTDVKEDAVDEEQVALAETIMKGKAAPFDPSAFQDHYRDAFFDVVKTKIEGAEPVIVEEEAAPKAFNFMDALKQSVEDATTTGKTGKKKTTKKKPAAKSVGARGKSKSAEGA